ncbi:hypothetical protein GF325_18410 [Candidatus Bathyarchaeota archaeon]|nr:hypothetical protein [Candidatus Bathyarchaeota archaeon]
MSQDYTDAQYLLQWAQDTQNGLAAHLNYHLQNNTPQLGQVAQAYRTLKQELGF